MAQIFKKCPHCDKTLTIFSGSKTTVCNYCGEEFKTPNLLDKDDTLFFKKFSEKELENTLKYNSLIGQGNEYVFNEQYDNAEITFKQAIDLDDKRYEAYYGVVRAKTHNFQSIPDTLDYLEYAKLALELAGDDIDTQINANLAKLNISKH